MALEAGPLNALPRPIPTSTVYIGHTRPDRSIVPLTDSQSSTAVQNACNP